MNVINLVSHNSPTALEKYADSCQEFHTETWEIVATGILSSILCILIAVAGFKSIKGIIAHIYEIKPKLARQQKSLLNLNGMNNTNRRSQLNIINLSKSQTRNINNTNPVGMPLLMDSENPLQTSSTTNLKIGNSNYNNYNNYNINNYNYIESDSKSKNTPPQHSLLGYGLGYGFNMNNNERNESSTQTQTQTITNTLTHTLSIRSLETSNSMFNRLLCDCKICLACYCCQCCQCCFGDAICLTNVRNELSVSAIICFGLAAWLQMIQVLMCQIASITSSLVFNSFDISLLLSKIKLF